MKSLKIKVSAYKRKEMSILLSLLVEELTGVKKSYKLAPSAKSEVLVSDSATFNVLDGSFRYMVEGILLRLNHEREREEESKPETEGERRPLIGFAISRIQREKRQKENGGLLSTSFS